MYYQTTLFGTLKACDEVLRRFNDPYDDYFLYSPSEQRAALDSAKDLALRREREKHWRKVRLQVYWRDGGRCMVCGASMTREDEQFWECGHIIDRFLGGPDHVNNLVVMCITCNRLKPGTRTRDEYLTWAVRGGFINEFLEDWRKGLIL